MTAPRTAHVALHATAFDEVPSGARNRAVGLAAAFLARGCRVTAIVPRALRLAPLVEAELGATLPPDRWREVATPLDPARPWLRAARAPRVLERAVPADADLLLTDYQPVLDRVPTALTVHDLRYLSAPRWESAARCAAFRALAPRLVRRARWIVVPSAAVGADAAQRWDLDPSRVVVAPNAVGRAWRGAAVGEPPRTHLLVVGVAERRKRVALLVEALGRAADQGEPLPLVAVGRGSRSSAAVLRGARDLVGAGLLRWEGPLPDDALVARMRSAAALLHPSAYEGFGMTVLEAFAAGTPVVAHPDAAVREVAGDLANWADGDDPDAWADAILDASVRVARTDERRDARRARAASFTWDRAAAAILDAARPQAR